jgi:hypothetical protein
VGDRTPTYTARQTGNFVTAHDIRGEDSFIAEDTLVLVVEHNQQHWIVALAAETEVVWFELTATLALAGTAAAKILLCDGSDGAAITVKDYHPSPGKYSGPAGYRGFALKTTCGNYAILSMDRLARTINFTMLANWAAGKASCSVQLYFDGRNPGSTLDVYDPQVLHAGKVMGDKGVATWNDILVRYEVTNMVDDPAESNRELYGKLVHAWVDENPPWTTVNPCADAAGNSPDTNTEHVVYWTLKGAQDPNAETDNVINYALGTDGEYVTTDKLDDPVSTIKEWAGAVSAIRQGWALMDGTANATGSGQDRPGYFVKGKGASTALSDLDAGGETEITIDDHPAADIAAAIQDHPDHGHENDSLTGKDLGSGAEEVTFDRHTSGTEAVGGGAQDPTPQEHVGSVTDVEHAPLTWEPTNKLTHWIERIPNDFVPE